MSTPQYPNPIDTPPGTTLSTPSPTSLHDRDPLSSIDTSTTMPPSRPLKHIYLIVATTPVTTPSGPRLGIGLRGSLPWPMIKADMNYFRRVTTEGREGRVEGSGSDGTEKRSVNSIIMGRKTYESIPSHLRPLGGRRNYVVTRSSPLELAGRYKGELEERSRAASDAVEEKRRRSGGSTGDGNADQGASPSDRDLTMANAQFTLVSSGLSVRITSSNDAINPLSITSSLSHAVTGFDSISTSTSPPTLTDDDIHSPTFCIGGAEIYKLILDDPTLRPRLRILQTEIQKLEELEGFECDTFWPGTLQDGEDGWREVGGDVVTGWLGVEVPQGVEEWRVVKGVGVRLRVRGWEVAG